MPHRKLPIYFMLGSVFFLLIVLCIVLLCPSVVSRIVSPARKQVTPSVPRPGPQLDPRQLDGTNVLEEVKNFVALGPRVSGTDGAEKAARYLADRLKKLGMDPIIEEFTQATPKGNMVFRNVWAVREGSRNKVILIVSHYDTKSGIGDNFVGANDSGSSTGLLLELARVLVESPRIDVDIMLAFVDGEECSFSYTAKDGLHGSRHLAKTLWGNRRTANVLGVFVVDMVGDKDLTMTIPANSSPELTTLVFRSAREEGVRLHFSLVPAIIDDHVPFLDAGMPAVDLIDLQFGSTPGKNDYWHTEEDTLDKLSAHSLQIVGRVLIRSVNKLALQLE